MSGKGLGIKLQKSIFPNSITGCHSDKACCFMGLDNPLELANSKWDEPPNPGKNHALSWFMIAVKTSKFSPRRVNKHHSAGLAMRALMCKDPTGLFDTLLKFFSPSSCPLYPSTSMPLWPFGLWALTLKLWASHHNNLATFGLQIFFSFSEVSPWTFI